MTDKNGREIVMGATVLALDTDDEGRVVGLTPEPNETYPNGTVKLEFNSGSGGGESYRHVDALTVVMPEPVIEFKEDLPEPASKEESAPPAPAKAPAAPKKTPAKKKAA